MYTHKHTYIYEPIYIHKQIHTHLYYFILQTDGQYLLPKYALLLINLDTYIRIDMIVYKTISGCEKRENIPRCIRGRYVLRYGESNLESKKRTHKVYPISSRLNNHRTFYFNVNFTVHLN